MGRSPFGAPAVRSTTFSKVKRRKDDHNNSRERLLNSLPSKHLSVCTHAVVCFHSHIIMRNDWPISISRFAGDTGEKANRRWKKNTTNNIISHQQFFTPIYLCVQLCSKPILNTLFFVYFTLLHVYDFSKHIPPPPCMGRTEKKGPLAGCSPAPPPPPQKKRVEMTNKSYLPLTRMGVNTTFLFGRRGVLETFTTPQRGSGGDRCASRAAEIATACEGCEPTPSRSTCSTAGLDQAAGCRT